MRVSGQRRGWAGGWAPGLGRGYGGGGGGLKGVGVNGKLYTLSIIHISVFNCLYCR